MKITPSIVDDILRNFEERGDRHYGEDVTERQHALQCATFAQRNGEAPSLVVACLLHDYGHLLHDLGEDIAEKGVDARHEDVGANRLKRHFIDEVVEPIRLHVAAKRYLCWKESDYLTGLSAASRQSLGLQGGPMNDQEGREFESLPHYDAAVRLRRYDDMGKVTDMETTEVAEFRTLIESFVRKSA